MGTAFSVEGGGELFVCVHGSKMTVGEVMFLAVKASVKRGEGERKEKFTHMINNKFFSLLLTAATFQFEGRRVKKPSKGV